MLRKGVRVCRNRNFGFRRATSEEDARGLCLTIVRTKDCIIINEFANGKPTGRKFYNAAKAPPVKILPPGQHYGFCDWHQRHSLVGIRIPDKMSKSGYTLIYTYEVRCFFWIEDGKVYSGYVYRKPTY